MYYNFFGLEHAPFKMTPDIKNFYRGGQRGAILDALIYAINNGEAITKVVGEVGSGKTMLCCMLASQLPEKVDIVYLANPNIKPDDVLKAISIELGLLVGADADRLQVMKNLQEFLLEKHADGRQVVVLVEEAHKMPLDTLEEIRLLTNLETQQRKLLQIVLFGQPELDRNLSLPKVRQIKDRITNSFYLPDLRRDEVHDYLLFRLHRAGFCEFNPFSRSSVSLLAWASKGVFRRINVLADKALLAAFSANSKSVNRSHVRKAVSDVEFCHNQLVKMPKLAMGFAVLVLISVVMFGGNVNFKSFVGTVINTATAEMVVATDRVADGIIEEIEPIAGGRQQSNAQADFTVSRESRGRADSKLFTIQILVTDSDKMASVERLFQRYGVSDLYSDLFFHKENINGRTMLSVTYGEFSSLAKAREELNRLPEFLKSNRPYLRNISQISGAVAKSVT